MALKIITDREEQESMAELQWVGHWIADRRLFFNLEKTEVVEADDPAARFLYAVPGRKIPMTEAIKYGLVTPEESKPPEPEPEPKPEPEPEPKKKAAPKAANKARKGKTANK